MDDHRIVAVEPEHPYFQRRPVTGRADQHRQVFALSILWVALRTPCQMSASGTPRSALARRSACRQSILSERAWGSQQS
jgi:hypothetical protein